MFWIRNFLSELTLLQADKRRRLYFFALQMRKQFGAYLVKENKSNCNFPLYVLTKENGKNSNIFSVSLDKKGVFWSLKDFVICT